MWVLSDNFSYKVKNYGEISAFMRSQYFQKFANAAAWRKGFAKHIESMYPSYKVETGSDDAFIKSLIKLKLVRISKTEPKNVEGRGGAPKKSTKTIGAVPKAKFKKGDKVKYLGKPAVIAAVEERLGKTYYAVSYKSGTGTTKARGITASSITK